MYLIEGNPTPSEIDKICAELLADPVVQDYSLDGMIPLTGEQIHIIEVAYNPGVLDPVEESTKKGYATSE